MKPEQQIITALKTIDCLYCNGTGIESKHTFDNSDVFDLTCDGCNGNGFIILNKLKTKNYDNNFSITNITGLQR